MAPTRRVRGRRCGGDRLKSEEQAAFALAFEAGVPVAARDTLGTDDFAEARAALRETLAWSAPSRRPPRSSGTPARRTHCDSGRTIGGRSYFVQVRTSTGRRRAPDVAACVKRWESAFLEASGDAEDQCALQSVGEDLQAADLLVAAIAPDVHPEPGSSDAFEPSQTKSSLHRSSAPSRSPWLKRP